MNEISSVADGNAEHDWHCVPADAMVALDSLNKWALGASLPIGQAANLVCEFETPEGEQDEVIVWQLIEQNLTPLQSGMFVAYAQGMPVADAHTLLTERFSGLGGLLGMRTSARALRQVEDAGGALAEALRLSHAMRRPEYQLCKQAILQRPKSQPTRRPNVGRSDLLNMYIEMEGDRNAMAERLIAEGSTSEGNAANYVSKNLSIARRSVSADSELATQLAVADQKWKQRDRPKDVKREPKVTSWHEGAAEDYNAGLSVKELAAKYGKSQPTITHALDRLLEKHRHSEQKPSYYAELVAKRSSKVHGGRGTHRRKS